MAAIQGNTTPCIGNTVTLTCATPGGVWSTNSPTATINQQGELDVTSTSTFTVYYTVNNGGCSAYASAVIAPVAPVTPIIKITPSSDTGCWSKTITFNTTITNGGPSPTFQWYRNGSLINGATNSTYTDSYIFPNTIYAVFMNANNVCQTNAHTSDQVNMNLDTGFRPSVSISASKNNICFYERVTFYASIVNGGPSPQIIWYVNNTQVATNTTTYTTNTLNNGDRVMCIIIANNACQIIGSTSSNTITMNVTTNAGNTTVAPIVGNSTPCVETWETYTCATPGGTWSINSSSPQTVLLSNGQLITYNTGSFTLSYYVKDNVGCNSSSMVITPQALPVVANITGNATHCVGSTVQLACATPGGVWSVNGTNAVINQQGQLTITGTGSFTAYYEVTGANGCTKKSSLIIVPKAKPTVAAITGNSKPCVGALATLACATPNGVWSVNSSNAAINQNGVVVTTTSGSFTVYYTVTVDGCSNYSFLPIVPSAATSSTTNTSITNIQLPYVWNGITITKAGTFTKRGLVNSNGCDRSATLVLTVTNAINITGPNSVCVGNNIQLSSNIAGGTWSQTGRITVSNTGLVTGVSAGNTSVVYTLANGASTTYSITVNALSAVPGIAFATGTSGVTGSGGYCKNKTFTLIGSPAGGSWSSTGVISITSGGVVTTGAVTGAASLVYTITNASGCNNSRTISGNVINCSNKGVNNTVVVINELFTLYPNPAHSIINLKIDRLVGTGTIIVTDLYGKQIKQQPLSLGTNTMDVSHLAKGMYLVSVVTEQGKQTQKVVVE